MGYNHGYLISFVVVVIATSTFYTGYCSIAFFTNFMLYNNLYFFYLEQNYFSRHFRSKSFFWSSILGSSRHSIYFFFITTISIFSPDVANEIIYSFAPTLIFLKEK